MNIHDIIHVYIGIDKLKLKVELEKQKYHFLLQDLIKILNICIFEFIFILIRF